MVASIKPQRDEVGLVDGRMLIGGEWVAAASGATWSHTHPATGEQVASFPVAGAADVDRAVRAARRAFDESPWPRMRAGQRGRILRKIADLVREHADELLKLQALDNSVPLSFGEIYVTSAEFVADVFEHHAGWVDKLAGERQEPGGRLRRLRRRHGGRGDHGHGHPGAVGPGLRRADRGSGAPGRGRRVPGDGRDDRRRRSSGRCYR